MLFSLVGNLTPRIVCESKAAFGGLIMFRAETIGDHDKRFAPLIDVLLSQHHAAQFNPCIAGSMGFHVTHHIQIDEDHEVFIHRIFGVRKSNWAYGKNGKMGIAIGSRANLGFRIFEVAKLNI